MKPKTFVAIAIMLFILVTGLIITLGLSSSTLLPIVLLLFLLIFVAAIVYIARRSLEGKIFASIIILVILVLTATFFLTTMKTYYDVVNKYGTPDNSPEIRLMQSQIDYYTAYASYLNQTILQYQSQSAIMENKLAGK